MVTLKEIARSCGCSIATVSKALNDMPDIGQATAVHIREVAAKMGYQPNAAARALKTNRSKVIGLLMFLRNESIWTHEYFGGIARSIQAEMDINGYNITPIDCRSIMDKYSCLDYCRARNYAGLILMSAGFPEKGLMELLDSDMPIVTVDYATQNRGAVLSDNVDGVRDLVRYIYDHGHRRIAFIHGDMTIVTKRRLASFYSTCEELGVDVPDEYVIPSVFHDTLASTEATQKLLSLKKPPTCILYPDDYSLIGGLNELSARGLRIPEDISIAGYDGIPLASVIKPSFTTVRQDCDGIGKNAAAMLLNAIDKPRSFIPSHMTLKSYLVRGETVGDVNPRELTGV